MQRMQFGLVRRERDAAGEERLRVRCGEAKSRILSKTVETFPLCFVYGLMAKDASRNSLAEIPVHEAQSFQIFL